jgi:Winged helix-turn helix
MAQQFLLISDSTTKVHHPCSQVNTSSSYSESLSKLQLMAACGLAQRSESRMGGRTGRTIHPQRGWEYLKRLDFSLQVPRPPHHKADPAQQELFKRELPEQVRQIQHAHPHAQVEVWAMDEHRVGLKPVIRRVWARKGHRPLIRVQQRYEWLYVYGFLHPETGASQWLLVQIA